MHLHLLPLSLLAVGLAAGLCAQTPIYPELSSNNFFRAVSTAKHAVTLNPYPVAGNQPQGYDLPSGVVPGMRSWTHNPKERTQAGATLGAFFTVQGMTQAVQPGAGAIAPFPNHYQFKTGIAPSVATTTQYKYEHATTGADLFTIASAPVVIAAWNILEIATTITTPVPFNQTELLLFAEYKGGEYREADNTYTVSGQSLASDWRGGVGYGGGVFCGFVDASTPRVHAPYIQPVYRPKIGLLVQEPTLTITGDHANQYYLPRLAGEQYRGLSGGVANWASGTTNNLFFDVRAGALYGSTGTAVVMLNMGLTWFPGSLQIGQFGNLLLNPGDPGLGALLGVPLTLLAGGNFNGEGTPIPIPTLGPAALGQWVKTQGVVFNAGLTNIALTTASSLKVES